MIHTADPTAQGQEASGHERPLWQSRLLQKLSYRNVGVVYVWIALIILFSIWVPSTFPTLATVREVLDGNAVVALLALSLVIPLSTRTFDLSVAYIATLSGVTCAYFVAHGMAIVGAVAIALGVSFLAGVVNAVVVVVLGVDSFIATLATGSLLLAFVTMITQNIAITSSRLLSGGFADIAQTTVAGVTLPVIYAIVVAIAIWYVLEHTATGRRLYATGFNSDSARLAGVQTRLLRFSSLIVSGLIAGGAGVVLVSSIGSGDPNAGTSYLLPAFAAAFVGATQLHNGRFNAWGTLIAVLMLGTGSTGLALAAAPQWTPNMFQGVALIAALAITGQQRRRLTTGWRWRPRMRTKTTGRSEEPAEAVAVDQQTP
ncbi:MAG TPA: ABC transporter permease [Solirubrobacteraceae bacterium]|jgi:ribose transport system permease protein|nr:ABC transporter permease [Solirubrobacteraceae bacterium]